LCTSIATHTLDSVLLTLADTLIYPSPGLIAWTVVMGLVLVAGAVTAAKGRWGWVLVGLLTGGLAWLVTAFLAPSADSFWAHRAAKASPT
jgi:hypothetical protein